MGILNMGTTANRANTHTTNTQETNTVNNINNVTNTHNRNDDILNGTLVDGSRFMFLDGGNFNTGIQEFRLNNLAMLGANGHGMLQQQPTMLGANGHGMRVMY